MRVSVRLQRKLWASALALSVAVGVPAAAAIGQVENSADPSAMANANTDASSPEEAKRLLLKARQALALNDIATAQAMIAAAQKQAVDFKQLGDSPATVQSMVDQLNTLMELSNQNDGSFNKKAATFLLKQAEALMYYQDFNSAEALIAQAKEFPVEFNSTTGIPDQLLNMIEVAKSNAAVAQTAVQNAQDATPALPSSKPQAMKLISQAQFAIDQGRWDDAKVFVDQAKSLNVPDTEFADDESRPWQLELVIQKALNRRSATADQGVALASGEFMSQPNVVQAGYDPANDSTANVQVAGTEDDAAVGFNRIPKTGPELYQAGIAALTAKNDDEARDYFERALNRSNELDPYVRQSLQDQLTRLTMSAPATRQWTQLASGSTEVADASAQTREKFRQLQVEVFSERAKAEQLLVSSPRNALEKMTMLRSRISQAELDQVDRNRLLGVIDRDLDKMQQYIDANMSEIINDETNTRVKEEVELSRERRVQVETQIQKLVEDFNKLADEQRYAEAVVVARQAADLAPDTEIVTVLLEKAKMLERIARMEGIRDDRENNVFNNLYEVEVAATGMDLSRGPYQMGDADEWLSRSETRRERAAAGQYSSESDRRIWSILKGQQVEGEYRGTLAEAIDQLAQQANVNIVFDDNALSAAGVQRDRPVDMPIRNPISLRSALDLILNTSGLVFVVENEVIKVTTREARQSKPIVKTYYIGDLVMPVQPAKHPMHMTFMQPGMGGGLGGSMNVDARGTSQLALAQQIGGGNPLNPFNGMGGMGGGYNGPGGGPQTGQATYGTVGGQPLGGVTLQDFQPLINLIQNTIQPETWQDTGQGLGTLSPYVSNLSLIVSQTQEIQDQIQDLLAKLRELNDVQIVVEVRFISLADNYFERIGVDFDFSINDNSAVIDPNADVATGGSTVIGRQPLDSVPFSPTSDLDLQFLQGSFTAAEPIFGNYQATTAANFGFAILSDIEVFFLIQASKGDQRTNITQAPVVTMFNGQSANVNDGASRPFVTSVIPVVGDFAVAHQPVITLLPDGTNLNVTAVVSDDRRFVRLQLVPFFSQVTEVETFTFDGSTTTERSTNSLLDDLLDSVNGGANADASDDELRTTTQGITVQLPVLSFTTVNTVVSVPDGGTVLMGGIKRMREGRTEAGVPFLSNLPYINRLFKNVGIGHETTNLMMMVTPRIIIQEEIEREQVGARDTN